MRFPWRFIALVTSTVLLGCHGGPRPDVYGLVTQTREVIIEDADHSKGGSFPDIKGNDKAELIELGVIIVVVATAAVVQAHSDHHVRKAVLYDIRLPDGTTWNLLQDESKPRAMLAPGESVLLRYGKGRTKDQHCFDPVFADAAGRRVLQLKECDFVSEDVPRSDSFRGMVIKPWTDVFKHTEESTHKGMPGQN